MYTTKTIVFQVQTYFGRVRMLDFRAMYFPHVSNSPAEFLIYDPVERRNGFYNIL